MSGYTQAGLEALARAVEDETRAADERNKTRGFTAHADRTAQARTDALKLAIEVTGYTRDARESGNHIADETLEIYANKFANFILTGKVQP